jgi:hypothetical protein
MKIEIKWKTGARFSADPEKAYEELEAIREKANGDIDPEAVVAKAKSKRSAMHNEFEWDDTVAAHEHRLATARTIVRSIQCVRSESPDVTARVYESVIVKQREQAEKAPTRVYRTTEDILKDPILRDQLIMTAIRELTSFRQKYSGLSELNNVFGAMDDYLRDVS